MSCSLHYCQCIIRRTCAERTTPTNSQPLSLLRRFEYEKAWDQKKHRLRTPRRLTPWHAGRARQSMLSSLSKACRSWARRTCQASILPQNWLPLESLDKHLSGLPNDSPGGCHLTGFCSLPEPLLADSATANTIARSSGRMSWHFNSPLSPLKRDSTAIPSK